jgi:carbon storage regulator
MLVLSRKRGEQIHIGEGVVLTVISIEGNRVRLGIEAPREVTVDRQEIQQRKIKERSLPQSQFRRFVTEVA